MSERIVFDLKLPEGSTCINLHTCDPHHILATYNVPEKGIQTYLLNATTGKSRLIILDEESE